MLKPGSRTGAPNELQALDAMRFVAAMAIVLYHFQRFLSEPVADVLAPVAHFHYAVDLFFVISGFVIAYVYDGRLATRREYGRFLRRRVARLAPLHWVTLGFYVVVGLALAGGVASSMHADNYDWGCVVPNAIGIHSFGVCNSLTFNFVSWSVSAEMGMYVIAPLVIAVGRRSRIAVVGIAAVVVIALTVVSAQPGMVPFLPERAWTLWTYDFGVLRALPAFCFGVALFFYRGVLARVPHAASLAAAAAVAFVIFAGFAPHPAVLVGLAYVIPALGVAADAQGRPGAASKILAPAGKLTYGVYMLHPLVLTVVLTLIGERMLHLSGAPMDLLIIVALALTIGLSMLSFHAFEDPARRWMSGRSRRGATEGVPATT